MSYLEVKKEGVLIRLYIQPGAKKTELSGTHGESLKIRIHAPPVDGKANAEVIRFLAETLDVAKSSIQFLTGEKSRSKTLLVTGLNIEQIKKALALGI